MASSDPAPRRLWSPAPDARSRTRLGAFWDRIEAITGRSFATYEDMWSWSVGEGLETFWAEILAFFHVIDKADASSATSSHPEPGRVLVDDAMPGAMWFPDLRLNYVDQVLRWVDTHRERDAIIGVSDSRDRVAMTWGELAHEVARVRAGLVALGVGRGDRVAALVPTLPESVIAFLATASLGAIWTSCAPEFGPQAVLDRFGQVEPVVLFAVTGYRYGEREMDRRRELATVRGGLASVRRTVLVPYGPLDPDLVDDPRVVDWAELGRETSPDGLGDRDLASSPDDRSTPVAFDHPLYVLYSSGTTGLPKAIVHGHGGILLEHVKVLGLHGDLGPEDRFAWFTTTGWMMWNYLVSGLLHGATVVLFDGDPVAGDRLWRMVAEERVTWFGTGSPMLAAAQRRGDRPGRDHDLSALRALGATGAPLPRETFAWVYDAIADDLLLSPISGGTDVCSAFVGGSPLTSVHEGEIPCRYLGAAVASFDPDGRSVLGEQGELVLTRPMPSMPVGFWGDDDRSRYRAAYFEDYPGVWRHGDWITITERGGCIISGRSDATLNRGGIRVGTAEVYRVVEAVDGIVDSLVVHLDSTDEDRLVLFVVLDSDVEDDEVADLVAAVRVAVRTEVSPRHVPDEVHVVSGIPTTLSGKKLEVPVKRVLQGEDAEAVASRDALRDPAAWDDIVRLADSRTT